MTQLIDKTTGEPVKNGDLIEWHTWDNDDYITWTFRGIYKEVSQESYVVYLGGGVDFGLAIGDHIGVDELLEDSENNDCSEQCGVTIVGNAHDVVKAVRGI